AINDEVSRSATSHTSPPLPPSPPSGPPLGVCASRRNDTDPAPPSPPRTLRRASSTNPDMEKGYGWRACRPPRVLRGRDDVDELAAFAGAGRPRARGPWEQRW